MGVEKILIAKELIDCEKWFKFDFAVPSLGSEELKDFLNTYIQGLHLAYAINELTEDSNDFLRLAYKGYAESKVDYGMDSNLLWLNTFGKRIVSNLHNLPMESMNFVLESTKYLEKTFIIESNSEILSLNLEKTLCDLNNKLDTPVNTRLFA